MLTLPQFIRGQTPADVERIFAKAGVKVRDGATYDYTSDGEVVDLGAWHQQMDDDEQAEQIQRPLFDVAAFGRSFRLWL